MRRVLIAVALTAAIGAIADAQTGMSPCDRRMVVSPDSLRAIATRLHPESADTVKRRAQVTVGLVFDSECRLVHHAVGTRSGRATADDILARLIPEASGTRYVTSGFVELPITVGADSLLYRLARAEHTDFGAPWVVWGVQQAAARRQ